MKRITLLLFAFFTTITFAQDPVAGYYINSNNQKITGEFAYGDYLSAETLQFRTGAGDFQRLNTNDVKEYGVSDNFKVIKYTIDIDYTDAARGRVSANKDPSYQKRTIFLNVLAEGDVTLYSYVDSRNTKYFYRTSQEEIPTQLVYRVYAKSDIQSAENNEYKLQLAKALVCNGMEVARVYRTPYQRYDLTNLVAAYNTCKGGISKVYSNKAGAKLETIFSVYAGLYATSFNIKDGTPPTDGPDKGVNFGIGGEMELLMPSKKTSLFLRLEYERLNVNLTAANPVNPAGNLPVYTYSTNSGVVSAFFGPRYYFKINDQSRLYVSAAASVTTVLNGKMDVDYKIFYYDNTVDTGHSDFKLGTAWSLNGGIGYCFDKNIILEFNINSNRDILNRFPIGSKTQYSRIGLNFRYALN